MLYGNGLLLVNKQMIKTGQGDIPDIKGLKAAITKKQSETEFLNDLKKVPQVYVHDVYQSHSDDSIRNPSGNVNDNSTNSPNQQNDAYKIGEKPANTARRKGTVKGYNVTSHELDKAFKSTQRQAYKVLSTLAEVTGIDIVLYKSTPGEDGTFRGGIVDGIDMSRSQGAFSWHNDKIYIDINSGLMNETEAEDVAKYAMLRTFAHEFTHFLEKYNAVDYVNFRELVFQTMERNGENPNEMVRAILSENSGWDYDRASREAVAEGMVDIVEDSHFTEELAGRHKGLLQTFVDQLKDFLNEIKQHFNALLKSKDVGSGLKEQIGDGIHYLEEIVNAFDKMAVRAVERYQETWTDSAESGSGTGNSDFVYSNKNLQEQAQPSKEDPSRLDAATVTEQDVRKLLMLASENKLHDGTFIPVRINTPDILLEFVDAVERSKGVFGKELVRQTADNPIVMPVGKAKQAIAIAENWYGEGNPHELAIDDVVSIVKKMDMPRYLVYEESTGRYVEIVNYRTVHGKNAIAVVEMGESKSAAHLNGYSGADYSVLITMFPPDSKDRVTRLLSTKGNIIFDVQKKKGNSQVTSGIRVPSVLNKLPFALNVPQQQAHVKEESGESYDGEFVYSERNVQGQAAGGYDYTKSFAAQIADYQSGNFPVDDTLMLGGTPDVLKKIGLIGLPMTINQKHIKDALNGTYKGTPQEKLDHTFTAQELATLPQKIADPIAIIHDKRIGKAKASESTIDVLVEMTVASGKEVIAAVQINGNGRLNGIRVDTNKVATVHGNSDAVARLVDAINENEKGSVALFYINNDKTTKVLQRTGNPIPSGLSDLDGFIHSIFDPGSPVKVRFSSVTETLQFKRWFGDWQNHPENASKVVNADGTPMIVYHGTNTQFNIFSSKSGEYWFSENKDYAESMMEERGGEEVKAVYLNMKNPYKVKLPPGQFSDPGYEAQILRNAKAAHHDGVIIENDTTNPLEAETFYVVFSPEQIKSATDNIGTFDGSNPDIRYQRRTTTLTNRDILTQASKIVDKQSLTDGQRYALQVFDRRLQELKDLEAQKREQYSILKMQRANGTFESEIRKTQNRIQTLNSMINRKSQELLSIEDKSVLKRVLEKARTVIEEKQAAENRKAMDSYRQRTIEGREKTAMRHKIQKAVKELNDLLIKPTRDKHIIPALQKPVAEMLEVLNMDTVNAAERIARLDELIAKETDPEVLQSLRERRDRIATMGENMGKRLADLKAEYSKIANSDDPDIAGVYLPEVAERIEYLGELVGDTPLWRIPTGFTTTRPGSARTHRRNPSRALFKTYIPKRQQTTSSSFSRI